MSERERLVGKVGRGERARRKVGRSYRARGEGRERGKSKGGREDSVWESELKEKVCCWGN